MKRNNFPTIFILVVSLLVFSTCKDSFLSENPKDFLSPTNYYNTEEEASAALMAVYAGLRSLYSHNMYFIGDMASEQTNQGEGTNIDRININNFQFEPENGITTGLWNSSYNNINRANAVIDRVPHISMDAGRRDVIVAEALFLRAFNYFNLVRVFGGVPLRLNETTSLAGLGLGRSSVEEVYDSIIGDLIAAEAVLPDRQTGVNSGRASKGAAATLLAYVYLTKKDWTNAVSKSQEVIDNADTYGYDLYDNYADLWIIENKNQMEHIFMCQYASGPENVGNHIGHFFMSRQANPIVLGGSGYGIHLVEDAFWRSFEPNDTRRDASILSSFIHPQTQEVVSYPSDGLTELSIFKYYDPAPFARNNNGNNYPILRYADVLLINAEARNESAGPDLQVYENINKIRRRANLDDLTPGLSQQEFRDAILQERNWEFCFEAKRYFDLMRTETVVPVMTAAGKNPRPENILFPIPQREIDINDQLSQEDQNPGY